MSYISDNNIKIGGHISFSKKIFPTLVNALDNNMSCFQFFLGSPKSISRQKLSEDDIVSTYNMACDKDISIFSHYPYTSSLCGSVNNLAWNDNIEQDTKTLKILKELEYEINTLSKLAPINGVVIHPGSNKNTEEALSTISKSINKISFDKNSKLLLENSAGAGTTLGRNFIDISKMIDGVDINKKKYVGVCIDTAHIYGSGIYNLSNKDEVEKMFHEFDKYIGLDKFNLLHLNDSMAAFSSKKDRHECVTKGLIWFQDNTSLKYLLKRCSELKIPIILETPDVIKDMIQINNF
jgi:apurinic endonuclease APN1